MLPSVLRCHDILGSNRTECVEPVSFVLTAPITTGLCASGISPSVRVYFRQSETPIAVRYTKLVIILEAIAHGGGIPNSQGTISLGDQHTVVGSWSPSVLSCIFRGSARDRPLKLDKITVRTPLSPELRAVLSGPGPVLMDCRYTHGPHMLVIFGVSMWVE